MKQGKFFLLSFFALFCFVFLFFFSRPSPADFVCETLAMRSIEGERIGYFTPEPKYFSFALDLGCSKRLLIKTINKKWDFKVSETRNNDIKKNNDIKIDSEFKALLDAGFSESEIRQYFDKKKNRKLSD